MPSRHRISQLELEVARLRKAVGDIQNSLGLPPAEISEPTPVQSGLSPGEDDSDDESIGTDIIATEQPSHLRSLFQNDWLSADIGVQNAQLQDRKAKGSSHLHDVARTTLQRLVPSKEDVLGLDLGARQWLEVIEAVLSQPFGLNTHEEMVENYDGMLKSDVDAMTLAAWLLDIALMAQHEPHFQRSPETSITRFYKAADFTRAVSDAVETTLFAHDGLLGTVSGLGMAMHFLRL